MLDLEIKDFGKNIPDAYHGTSQQIAEEIEDSGKFLPSTGEKQYLGDGVYFFESSERHAKEWARNVRKFREIGIFCASINLGRCLELNDKAHRDFVSVTGKKLQKMSGRKTITDAFVINFITNNFATKIDAVRACFVDPDYDGGKLFPGSRFYNYSQLIVCVKTLQNIMEFSITYKGS